ncbi:MAG: flagellar export protein FliJ [Lachnospiraceae bacterium]|nr:flagellar export protein FliJ [Lachnospiraceae bacterium]
MPRFRYRMQNILTLDEKLEDQQKASFAMANSRLQDEQKALQDLLLKKASYEQRVKQHAMGEVDIKEIQRCKEGVRVTDILIRSQMIEIRKAQRLVDVERTKLNEAMQARKTQEKLKEKAFEKFKEEMAAEENMVTDELISFKYGTGGGQ